MLFWQAQMGEQQTTTKMTKDWLASRELEEAELETKVKRLETYINDHVPINIEELQVTESWKLSILITHEIRTGNRIFYSIFKHKSLIYLHIVNMYLYLGESRGTLLCIERFKIFDRVPKRAYWQSGSSAIQTAEHGKSIVQNICLKCSTASFKYYCFTSSCEEWGYGVVALGVTTEVSHSMQLWSRHHCTPFWSYYRCYRSTE